MYTDKKNILQLVALLEAHGITKVVLCPGSRNAPIVHTLSNHPGFTCYAMTDERSAGYFAIGLTLNGGKPFLRIVPLPGSGRWTDRLCRSLMYSGRWSRSP